MRKLSMLILISSATACGSVSDGSRDAAVPEADAASIDAQPGSCSPEQTFGTPVLVAGLESTVLDGSARLSPDELTVFLSRGDPTVADILTATRSSTSVPFDAPQALVGFDNPDEGTHLPTVTGDGLTMVFVTSVRGPLGEIASLSLTRRNTPTGAFSTPVALDGVNTATPFRDTMPYLIPSGERLYYTNTPEDPLNTDIWVAAASGDTYGSPVRIDEVSSAGPDLFPVVSEDELAIYFGRIPMAGMPLDIVVATRASTSDPFSGVRSIDELNNPTTGERPTWISPDQCRLYFVSDRGVGQTEIYVAERTPSN